MTSENNSYPEESLRYSIISLFQVATKLIFVTTIPFAAFRFDLQLIVSVGLPLEIVEILNRLSFLSGKRLGCDGRPTHQEFTGQVSAAGDVRTGPRQSLLCAVAATHHRPRRLPHLPPLGEEGRREAEPCSAL